MKRWKKMHYAGDRKFLRQVGIPRSTFETIVEKINAYQEAERGRNRMKNRGVKTTGLPVEDRLLLTLYYLRHYLTFENLGDVFGISQGYANKRYHEYLDLLVTILRLPGRKALRDETWKAVLIDVTEQPIERPGKKQGRWFSGKKKRHTAKVQLIVCLFTLQILSVTCGTGRMADFRVFKESKMPLADALEKYADAGYQGLETLLKNAFTPIKKPRNGELTKAERAYNRALARLRVRIEHVNRRCKIFRVSKEVYRGHRRYFQKIWMVVAARVNYRYAE